MIPSKFDGFEIASKGFPRVGWKGNSHGYGKGRSEGMSGPSEEGLTERRGLSCCGGRRDSGRRRRGGERGGAGGRKEPG
jgi:hypothetical protein